MIKKDDTAGYYLSREPTTLRKEVHVKPVVLSSSHLFGSRRMPRAPAAKRISKRSDGTTENRPHTNINMDNKKIKCKNFWNKNN